MRNYEKKTFAYSRATVLSISFTDANQGDRKALKDFLARYGIHRSGRMLFFGHKTPDEFKTFLDAFEHYIDEIPAPVAITNCKIFEDGHLVFELLQKVTNDN